jgi:DNA polymerase III epsilon subunit-like protein
MSAKYLIIDTETTGLYFGKNGLIQLACIVLDSKMNEMHRFCVDVCPNEPFEVSEESMKITGFTMDRIYAGVSYQAICELFLDLLDEFFPNTKPVVVAQFYPFDYAFLNQVFMESNLHLELNQKLSNDFIDTKAIVNTINLQADLQNQPKPFPITSLSKEGGLKDVLGISQETFVAHDALGDCLATKEVLLKLVDFIKI